MKNFTAINTRFNRELERYKAGYMLSNEVFHLGKPQGILKFHGRRPENIIYPILQNNTLIWVDKKKGLDWLSSASPNVQQELTTSILSDVANIINKFDNPKIPKDYIRDVDMSVLNRISHVTVYPLRHKGYAIRCKVDGEWQLAVELSAEDAAKVNPYMDKKLLATKYFKEELDLNEFQEQVQSKDMKI